MKFVYEYRTSDNVLHDGSVAAPSRDAAFAALRAKGIRPSRLSDAPGFFNWLFGRGKRWLAIGVLTLATLVLAAALARARAGASSSARSADRQQVYGDPVLLAECRANGWAGVFAREGERFLAAYAEPGRAAPVEFGRPAKGADGFYEMIGRTLDAALEVASLPQADNPDEISKIKLIVAGMKDELRAYLADGGTSGLYARRVIERQDEERAIRNRLCNQLATLASRGTLTAADRATANRQLRDMGICPITDSELKDRIGKIRKP